MKILVLLILLGVKKLVLVVCATVVDVNISSLFDGNAIACCSRGLPYSQLLTFRLASRITALNPYYLHSIVFAAKKSDFFPVVGGFYQSSRPVRFETFTHPLVINVGDSDLSAYQSEIFSEFSVKVGSQLSARVYSSPIRLGLLKPSHLTGKNFFLNSVRRAGRKSKPERAGYNALGRRKRRFKKRNWLRTAALREDLGLGLPSHQTRRRVEQERRIEPHRVMKRFRRWPKKANKRYTPQTARHAARYSRRRFFRDRARFMYDWRKPWRRASGRLKRYTRSTIKRSYTVNYMRHGNRADYTAWRRVGAAGLFARRAQLRRLQHRNAYAFLKYPYSVRLKRFFKRPRLDRLRDMSLGLNSFFTVPGKLLYEIFGFSSVEAARPAVNGVCFGLFSQVGSSGGKAVLSIVGRFDGMVTRAWLFDGSSGSFAARLHSGTADVASTNFGASRGVPTAGHAANRRLLKNSLVLVRQAGKYKSLHGFKKLPVARGRLPVGPRFSYRQFLLNRVWAALRYWGRSREAVLDDDVDKIGDFGYFFNGMFPYALVSDSFTFSRLRIPFVGRWFYNPSKAVESVFLTLVVLQNSRCSAVKKFWYTCQLFPSKAAFVSGRRFVFVRFKGR